MKEKIYNDFREKGVRLTRVRRALVDIFTGKVVPLSAAELQAHLKKKSIATNKSTVYRELVFLKGEGIIAEVDFGDATERYELALAPHHHHLICTNCHKVEDTAAEARISKKHGFKITEHKLEFFGLCQSCQ